MSLSESASAPRFEPHLGRSVSIEHAARLLGVSRRTVYNRIGDGQLRTVRTLGGSQRVLLESVVALGGRLPDEASRKTSPVMATAAIALALMAGAVRPAGTQPHPARLSADLNDQLFVCRTSASSWFSLVTNPGDCITP